jgi:hypothetical protein
MGSGRISERRTRGREGGLGDKEELEGKGSEGTED